MAVWEFRLRIIKYQIDCERASVCGGVAGGLLNSRLYGRGAEKKARAGLAADPGRVIRLLGPQSGLDD